MNADGKRPLPEGWVWTTIGEITQPIHKVRPEEQPDKPFTYLDISAIDNQRNVIAEPKTYYGVDAPSRARQQVQSSDVLFSTVRTYLKNIALVPEQYDNQVASTGFAVLRGVAGVQGKYLFYYTLTESFLEALSKLQRGTSYPAVRDSDVREQSIPLAPPAEQERIVAEIEKQFTRLDAAVSALRQVQGNLARYKAAVLKAACEGRLVAQDPNDEPASELLARISAERRRQWEASGKKGTYREPVGVDVEAAGLPELPKGWVWATIEQIAEHRLGKMLDKEKNRGNPRPYLRNANVRWFHFDLSDLQYMRVLDSELENVSVREGDLVVCEGGEPGRSAVWEKPESAVIQKALHRVRPELGISPWYLAYRIASDAQMGNLDGYFTGSTIKHFTGQALRSYVLALPPSQEQSRIVEEVERRLSVLQAVEQVIEANIARAERLRQGILQRAFSGRLVNVNVDRGSSL